MLKAILRPADESKGLVGYGTSHYLLQIAASISVADESSQVLLYRRPHTLKQRCPGNSFKVMFGYIRTL